MNLLTSDVCLSYKFVGILFEKKKYIFCMRCNRKQPHLNSLKGWFTKSPCPPGPEAGEGHGDANCVQGTRLADRDVVVKGSACVVR